MAFKCQENDYFFRSVKLNGKEESIRRLFYLLQGKERNRGASFRFWKASTL